jgi:hypothetical protein
MTTKWVAVYTDTLQSAALLKSFLESDQLEIKMVPDVQSPPLQSPGPHSVKSQYTQYLVLAREDQVERARELIADYFDKGKKGAPPE